MSRASVRRISSDSFRRSSRTSDKQQRQSRRTNRNSYASRLSKWELEDLDDENENADAIDEVEEPADDEATAPAPTPRLVEQEALKAKEVAPVAQRSLEKMKRSAEMGEDIEGDEGLPFSQAVVRKRATERSTALPCISHSPSVEVAPILTHRWTCVPRFSSRLRGVTCFRC